MLKPKLIKDAVHGYIEIDSEYMKIIDSIQFQRLRRIEQTSYRVIYPSARHDRFVHSIGTFFLGKKAFFNFKKNIKEDEPEKIKSLSEDFWNVCEKTFHIACLLHDVGHAPFSHTCEYYFEQKKIKNDENVLEPYIVNRLINLVNNIYSNNEVALRFENEFKDISKSPHEIVSAIVLAEKFRESLIDMNADIELAIRMIIGCTYDFLAIDDKEVMLENGIKNCLIRFLNSSTIDVDKLDYIIRDTTMTGYENNAIDTERLLKAVTGIVYSENDFYPAFRKNALSIVENVVNAKNSQKNWIVGHHAVVYEAYLIQTSINEIADRIAKEVSTSTTLLTKDEVIEKIFSVEALTGKVEIGNYVFNFLSDDDIWCLFKKNIDIPSVTELLDRNERKKPIWKSFAEYNYLFKTDNIDYENFMEKFRIINSLLVGDNSKVINNALLDRAEKQYKRSDEKLKGLYGLQSLSSNLSIDFEFTILNAEISDKKIISNNELYIRFGDEAGPVSFNILMGRDKNIEQSSTKSSYFYIYHKKRISKEDFFSTIKNKLIRRPRS